MSFNEAKMQKLHEAVEKLGYSVYDIEWKTVNNTDNLTIFLDKADDLNTIIDATRAINQYLDSDDVKEQEYMLEVSSKGLIRRLTKLRHFQASLGDVIAFKLGSEKMTGEIISVVGENVVVNVDGKDMEINWSEIKKCKTIMQDKEKNEQ